MTANRAIIDIAPDMAWDQQHYRLRMALAAKAYADDVVRLAERDLAGFDHLAASRHGLFAVGPGGKRLLVHGQFYGLTVAPGTIYAFEACDRPRTRSNRGRLIRIAHADGRIRDATVIARGLDNGGHQLDLIDGALYLTDTYNQRLLRCTVEGGASEIVSPLPPPAADGTGYVHVNSLLAHGERRYLLLHNDGGRTGRDSAIAVFDPAWRRIDTIPLNGRNCHSLALLEDGTLLSCGSADGALVGSDGRTIKLCDLLTRGLSIDDTMVVVGGSAVLERALRDEAPGQVMFLDRDYRPLATVELPGPVMEIRRIDGRDRSLSAHLATLAPPAPPAPPRGGRVRRIAAAGWRLLSSADARSELATRIAHGGAVHQDVTLSWTDRYPRLFAAAAELLRDVPAPNLLSFGCSAGEEVLSLKRAIPTATITGVEVNRAKLRACRRLPTDPTLRFAESTPANIAAHGPYDAIFCMAVLTRRPHEVAARGLTSIAAFYPFHRFRAQLRALVGELRAGGLLVVEHTLYRVEDLATELSLAPVAGIWPAKGPRFDPSGALIVPQPTVARIFRKLA